MKLLAESWDDLDEEPLEQALSQLEALHLHEAKAKNTDNAWIFTQLARGSTELSAMIVNLLPSRRYLHSSQA